MVPISTVQKDGFRAMIKSLTLNHSTVIVILLAINAVNTSCTGEKNIKFRETDIILKNTAI